MKLDYKNKSALHVKELLHVFNDIEFRIKKLHQNSSQVFLKLNKVLKEYYKKKSIISTNAIQILDTIVGNNGTSLTDELNVIFKDLENFKSKSENELKTNLATYSHLINKIENVWLILRHFKQDFMTLKYLIANYKLISNSESANSEFFTSLQKLENVLSSIYPWLTEVGKETTELCKYLNNFSNINKSYSQNSINTTYIFYEELKSVNTLINNKNLESKNYIPILKEKINSSTECLGDIIKHLQYHDIIKQKIEHIQQSHFKIIDSLKKDTDISGRKFITENDKKFSTIADIADLQSSQLVLITKEYQKALEVISNNFQKIADDLKTISTISCGFLMETKDSDTTIIKLVKEKLNKSLLLLDEYNSNSFNMDLFMAKQQIVELNRNANQRIIKPLVETESIFNVHEKLSITNRFKENENIQNIVNQLTSSIHDMYRRNDDLQKNLIEILKLSESFVIENDLHGFRSNLEKEQIRIMVEISSTLDRLDDESMQFDSVIFQNCDIQKDIVERLKETINHDDCFELFEKVLNEIIDQLTLINIRLKNNKNVDKIDRINNLKEMESYYTVDSERVIHQMAIEEAEIVLHESSKHDEEIEFF